MKKILSILGICVFLCLTKNAFANDYTKIYTVGNSGSEVQKTTFGWDEKPWLFLDLPSAVYDWAATVSTWSWSGGAAHSTIPGTDLLNNVGNKVWLSFSDARWDSFKEQGSWLINPITILVSGYTPTFIAGQTSCTVTPEPISCALFLLGGGALFAARKRKKA